MPLFARMYRRFMLCNEQYGKSEANLRLLLRLGDELVPAVLTALIEVHNKHFLLASTYSKLPPVELMDAPNGFVAPSAAAATTLALLRARWARPPPSQDQQLFSLTTLAGRFIELPTPDGLGAAPVMSPLYH